MKRGKYKDFAFHVFDEVFIEAQGFRLIDQDSVNWRIYYSNGNSNWIKFYPFSEYHGGGQPYIVDIEKHDFIEWIVDNQDFEKDIRKIIGMNKCAT